MNLVELRAHFRRDALASVVVFLVVLPLCMGIALASGVPPALGLITGIIGGIVVGALAGSPLQVSGPAAGLAVIVWELVERHGVAMFGPIVLVADALQVAAGASPADPQNHTPISESPLDLPPHLGVPWLWQQRYRYARISHDP